MTFALACVMLITFLLITSKHVRNFEHVGELLPLQSGFRSVQTVKLVGLGFMSGYDM
jgi:hypothetical protein